MSKNYKRKRRKIFRGEQKQKRKKRKIFGEGKMFFFVGEKNAFLEEKKSRKGKGGKYLEKEKGFFARRMKTKKEK